MSNHEPLSLVSNLAQAQQSKNFPVFTSIPLKSKLTQMPFFFMNGGVRHTRMWAGVKTKAQALTDKLMLFVVIYLFNFYYRISHTFISHVEKKLNRKCLARVCLFEVHLTVQALPLQLSPVIHGDFSLRFCVLPHNPSFSQMGKHLGQCYRKPTVESGKNVTFFEQLFCFYQLVLAV